jgi:acyl carrier protein
MGLDLVELVVRIEDAFGIAIPDKVATELTTPRKVTDYVLTQVNASDESSCLSQQAFYFLRKHFVMVLDIPPGQFHPNQQLSNLIPLEQRREIWLMLKSKLGASGLPNLARPFWLFSALSFLSVLTLVIANIYGRQREAGSSTSFLFGLFAAIAVAYGGAVVSRPWQRNFRKGYECAGDLAKYLVVHNPALFKQEWTREQISEVVKEIIVDETGVKDFTEDSHFIKDMHLD